MQFFARIATIVSNPYFPDQNPILPVYADEMGMLRVKRDSPYLSKILMSTKTNTMPCCVLVCQSDTQKKKNCYSNGQYVGATNSARVSPNYFAKPRCTPRVVVSNSVFTVCNV